MFNENQIHEIEAHGLTVAQVEAQIEAFKRGFPSLEVVKAASPEDGITILSEEQCDNAVKYNKDNRKDVIEISQIMKAEIVDMSKNQMTLQICDTPEKTKLLIKMLQGISIVEVARTGALALTKCTDHD